MKKNTLIMSGYIQRSDEDKLNPSLIFDKYLLWELDNRNETPTLNIRRGGRRIDCKEEHFKMVINLKPPLTSDQYTQLKNKKNSLPGMSNFTLTTRTRLIVNHGGESILDNSIALHPYYGFPIIPGSAIKGVTRQYCEEFENLDKDIKKIFGNFPGDKEAEEGCIIFLDAWPDEIDGTEFLELDVFTPHYQDYYQEKKLPRDDQSPIPVNFLAVQKGVRFEFAIAPSSRCGEDEAQNLIDKTVKLIADALMTFGIGAKTGSNYGYFE